MCPDLPCSVASSRGDADVVRGGDRGGGGAGGSNRRPGYSFDYTMENRGVRTDIEIDATTRLWSEVPVQYFAWELFNIMDTKYPLPKTAPKMMAAFVSNCGSQVRNDLLRELMEHGVTIDSFGGCVHNAKEPSDVVQMCNGGKQCVKEKLSERYLFVYAAENSRTNDYVTEKFFLPLCLGTVPVRLGPDNIAHFAPSETAVIDRTAYNSTKAMAKHMISLAKDPEKYADYVRWKVDGPSRHFVALMDLGNLHSFCRLCIRVGDYIRKSYDNYVDHEEVDMDMVLRDDLRWFYVRDRHTLFLSVIYVPKSVFSLRNIRLAIKKKLGFDDLYTVYYLWDRNQVPLTRKDLPQLKDGDELEAIFLDSQKGKRFAAEEWFDDPEAGRVKTRQNLERMMASITGKF